MSNSFSHPQMISNMSGQFINQDYKSLVKQNLSLFLQSRRTELFGDPYYGTNLIQLVFEQNDTIVQDLIIDEIFNGIRRFFKELSVQRQDIEIIKNNKKLIARIKLLYNQDGSNDIYNIALTTASGVQDV